MALRIILSGGGTAGPVTPLLAVVERLREKEPDLSLLWIGTGIGPEQKLVEDSGITFRTISSGKLRRYFSWQNFIDPLRVVKGFLESMRIIDEFKPDLILSAGGFVSVPLIWAGNLRRVPSIVHQQDYQVLLSTRLAAPFAKLVTVAFADTAKNFPADKARWVGHPVRRALLESSPLEARELFKLESGVPTVLVTGGGTGAADLNKIVVSALPELLKFCQVIHLTGKGKLLETALPENLRSRYHPFEFLSGEMGLAYAAADVVVSRAGASATFELASLGKTAILVPLPDSPQLANAAAAERAKGVLVINQSELSPSKLASTVKSLFDDALAMNKLSENIKKLNTPDAAEKFIELIWEITKKPRP